MASAGMALINAVGSSLFSVGVFGLTTAGNYALDGLVDWRLAATFIGGGLLGGLVGIWAGRHLKQYKGALNRVFAAVVALAALYILWRALPTLF